VEVKINKHLDKRNKKGEEEADGKKNDDWRK